MTARRRVSLQVSAMVAVMETLANWSQIGQIGVGPSQLFKRQSTMLKTPPIFRLRAAVLALKMGI